MMTKMTRGEMVLGTKQLGFGTKRRRAKIEAKRLGGGERLVGKWFGEKLVTAIGSTLYIHL